MAPAQLPFGVEPVDAGGGVTEVRLTGKLVLADGPALWRTLRLQTANENNRKLRFDLSGVESMDGGAMALLVQTSWALHAAGRSCEIVGGRPSVQRILELYEGAAEPSKPSPVVPVSALAQVGRATFEALVEVQLVLAFFGSMVLAMGGIVRRPKTANWAEVASIMNRTGPDALPIVLIVNLLIGFVMGFQSAAQLKQFGANIFVADLVGLSITRELGPLMTAIIVCGRSGAAFAAEAGHHEGVRGG